MNTMAKHTTISQKTIRIAAARAEADPRTVERAVLGLPIRTVLVRERVLAELKRLGVELPLLQVADDLEPARAAGGGR